MQFAYTCIQDHDVWFDTQFWEACFFHDVHIQLRELYMNNTLGSVSSSSKRTTKHFQGMVIFDLTIHKLDQPPTL
ncbi:unnamed protein product [Soboliphyme baturini]|uniref:SBF2 domain-containing protein n=1 Tax=Soboliphyme baturini TaxID=241478 RepID=A0A183JA62_9BILA|nr:unnamed protein product [Soboliphyme baturini]